MSSITPTDQGSDAVGLPSHVVTNPVEEKAKDHISKANLLPRTETVRSIPNKVHTYEKGQPDETDAFFQKNIPSHSIKEKTSSIQTTASKQTIKKVEELIETSERFRAGVGASKAVDRIPLKERVDFKLIKTFIKTSKTQKTESPSETNVEEQEKVESNAEKINHIFRAVIATFVSGVIEIFEKLGLIDLVKSFSADQKEKLQKDFKELERAVEKFAPEFKKNEESQAEYPTIHTFLNKGLSYSTFLEASKKDRTLLREELKDYLKKSEQGFVVYSSSDKEEFENELAKAEEVREAVKTIDDSSNKKFLAIPLTFTTKSQEKTLIDRYYNLGDVKTLLGDDDENNPLPSRLSPDERVEVSIQAAKGLLALHKARIVHGDFAARNVLARHKFDKNGKYKLEVAISDWGHSLPFGKKWESDKGPLFWSSPEVLNKKSLTGASDAWSFGIFLLELIEPNGNIYKFFDNDDHAIHARGVARPEVYKRDYQTEKPYIENILDDYFEKVKEQNISLDPDFRTFLLSLFEFNPGKRPTDEDIITTLEKFQREGKTFVINRNEINPPITSS